MLGKTPRSRKPEKRTSGVDHRVVALLERIAGDGQADAVLSRLCNEPAERVADDIARSAAFEHLYKRGRTRDIGVEGAKEANPALVGLPALPPDLTFDEQYRRYFRPRLDKRAEGFDMLFQSLQALGRSLLIVETGTLRLPGNWEGDGQSTFMFDALVRESGGVLISIDVTNESVDSVRRRLGLRNQI